MFRFATCVTSLVATLLLTVSTAVQAGFGQDADAVVANGGIFAEGWMGIVDPSSAQQGRAVRDGRLAAEGSTLHITTGPAATYWNPANGARGSYTVKAIFREPSFMGRNDHPHPYGLFIGGSDMGTNRMRILYCVTYGDGAALVRGFGPAVFTLFGPAKASAVHATAPGQPVEQEIAWQVTPAGATCLVNGESIATYPRAQLVERNRLRSTDGIYGIRVAHNVEVIVSGLAMSD